MTSRTRRGGRGGYQKPSNPAPVSGVGRGSQRTDGGPGQPVRELPAEATGGYGTRQEHTALQGAAPMAGGGEAQLSPAAPPRPAGVFGPTTQPDVDVAAGLGSQPEPIMPPDHIALMRQIYAMAPTPALKKLIFFAERNGL